LRDAGVDKSQAFRGGQRNVNYAPSDVWATVVDPQQYVLVILEVSDTDDSSKGERQVRCRESI
jgi:hypothetical protein